MFAEVAPGVFSVEHQVVEGKNAIVFGSRGALAIDGGMYPEEGRAMAGFIRERGCEPVRLALTHGHGDHVLGAGPLAGGEVFAHARTERVIRRQVPGWAARRGIAEEEVVGELVWPTVTFSDELRVDLGGRTVRFFPTPGHSEDGVGAFVEEDQVLVGGDTVVTGIVPAIGDGDGRLLERSLRRLAQMEIAVLVPGHGPVLHGVETVRDWLRWEAGYLAGVRQRVRGALDAGNSAAAAVDAAGFADCVGGRLPDDRYGMPQRHRNTVEKIVAEEVERRGEETGG